MNMMYEQSIAPDADEPTLEERIDGLLYEPTLDGVSSAEFDLKWVRELVTKTQAELNDAHARFKITADAVMVELCEWETGELVRRQGTLSGFLPKLRKLYHAVERLALEPLETNEKEQRPISVDSIFGEET